MHENTTGCIVTDSLSAFRHMHPPEDPTSGLTSEEQEMLRQTVEEAVDRAYGKEGEKNEWHGTALWENTEVREMVPEDINRDDGVRGSSERSTIPGKVIAAIDSEEGGELLENALSRNAPGKPKKTSGGMLHDIGTAPVLIEQKHIENEPHDVITGRGISILDSMTDQLMHPDKYPGLYKGWVLVPKGSVPGEGHVLASTYFQISKNVNPSERNANDDPYSEELIAEINSLQMDGDASPDTLIDAVRSTINWLVVDEDVPGATTRLGAEVFPKLAELNGYEHAIWWRNKCIRKRGCFPAHDVAHSNEIIVPEGLELAQDPRLARTGGNEPSRKFLKAIGGFEIATLYDPGLALRVHDNIAYLMQAMREYLFGDLKEIARKIKERDQGNLKRFAA